MDLRSKLGRVDRLRREQPTVTTREKSSDPPLETLVPGNWIAKGDARCFATEEPYARAYRHGDVALQEALEVPTEVWASLLRNQEADEFQIGRAHFVDIETTGLSRGAGTFAFLVGVGSFREDAFVVRQYFMPDYGEEDALLDLLAQDLESGSGLVTFNGRSFDWPILETRYFMAQRRPPLESPPHLDLLHLSRRLWRRSLDSCTLSSLEQEVLGIQRDSSDVPGYLIPQLYADYVERGRTRPMADVFYHNLIDVLSMVSLAARAATFVALPGHEERPEPCDYYSLAILFEGQGRYDDAIQAYRMAIEGVGSPHRQDARKRLSYLYKRLHVFDAAMEMWRQDLEGDILYPYVELAMQYEHRLRDLTEAQKIVRRAIEGVTTGQVPLSRFEARRALKELDHRLVRIERRIESSEQTKPSPAASESIN